MRRTGQLMLLCLLIGNAVVSGAQLADFSGSPQVGGRFLDVHSFLFKLAAKNNWSLLISSEVNSPIREVVGSNIKEALEHYFDKTRFGWRLFDNCLYVAAETDLVLFLNCLPQLETTLPKGKNEIKFNGNFSGIEIDILCNMLRGLSGFEIRSADSLHHRLMIRANNMSWQRVLLAVVCLNRLRIDRTDYSITILPSD